MPLLARLHARTSSAANRISISSPPRFDLALTHTRKGVTIQVLYRRAMSSETPVPITTAPKEGQLVEHDGKLYRTIKEGLAYILVPPNVKTQQDPRAKSKAGKLRHSYYDQWWHS